LSVRGTGPTSHPAHARFVLASLLTVAAGTMAGGEAAASTIAQNVSWTIDRPESETTHRIVAYGDSIYAGYKGSISRVAVWSAPNVDADYVSALWGTDVEVVRRTKSGAKAADIYENKIVDDAAYMQTPETRIVTFEMCGNDALQARDDFSGQGSTCDYSRLDSALADCTVNQELAMAYINANASPSVLRKVVANLYYPSYAFDDVDAACTDATTGGHPNKQDVVLPYLLRMNWRACDFAQRYGFECADTFAQFMGSDYDSNADGKRDAVALRYRRGESEDAYVLRLGTTLRETIRDANTHFVRAGTSFDYIQSDDTHPTFRGETISIGALGGSGTGASGPRLAVEKYRNGKLRFAKKFGHERMGWALSKYNPATP
jgi:lysophospholipase L1-like esterase